MGCGCGTKAVWEQLNSSTNKSNRNRNNQNEFGIWSILSSISSECYKNNEKHLNLQDYLYTKINQFTYELTRYYKNQFPPVDKIKAFTDTLFPPNDNSIFGLDKHGKYTDPIVERRNECSSYFKVQPGSSVWKRAKDIFNGQPYSVFEGKIEAGDSIQGGVGDCYFLAAISAIAEFPQMICQIFKTNSITSNGCYEIALRLNGEWKLVILDDYFPCSKTTNLPIFCKPNGNEIWSMLLEKAWAKVNGGYLNIDSGFTVEVLSTLTPFPTEIIYHQEITPQELWKRISESDKQDHILTCMTKFDEGIEHYGLISGHSCTLVSAFEKTIKNKKIKLLKIRNPWGYKEWSGKYSDNSPEWDEETIKAFVDVKVKEDGIFWMEFDDYWKFFEETEICHAKRSICVRNIKMSKERTVHPNWFRLRLHQRTSVDITIIKKSYRFNRKIVFAEDIITNWILVKIKTKENDIELIGTTSSSRKNSIISDVLEPGDYIIYFHVDYTHGHYDKIRKYSLDIACDNYFTLFDVGVDKNFYFLKKIIESSVVVKERNERNEDQICKHIIEDLSSGFENTTYGYLYLKNISIKPHRIHIMPSLTNWCLIEEKYQDKSCDPENIESILMTNNVFILLTNTIDFYKNTEISFTYEKFHLKEKSVTSKRGSIPSNNKNHYLYKIISPPEKCRLPYFESYSFIYNRIKFDLCDVVKQIDYKKLALKTMQERYPEDMRELLKMEPWNDNEDVIFRDRYYIGKDYYFGEQHWVSMIRHGRGMFYWHKDGWLFIGYSVKGQFNGKGKFIYPNGEIHEGVFQDDHLCGKGNIIYPGGAKKSVVFPLDKND